MSTITLTDRISVRVTAKDSTETSNQNKTNGNNVAKSLTGDSGTSLTDSAAEAVGAALGDTVTGENGKQYAKIGGVINAIKAASNSGELDNEKEEYEHYPGDDAIPAFNFGTGGTIQFAPDATATNTYFSTDIIRNGAIVELDNTDGVRFIALRYDQPPYNDGQVLSLYVFPYTSPQRNFKYVTGGDGSPYYTSPGSSISGCSGSFYRGSERFQYCAYRSGHNDFYGMAMSPCHGRGDNDIGSYISSYSYCASVATAMVGGSVVHHGGLKVDTSKSDAQIAQEIEAAARQSGNIQNIGTDTYIAVTDDNGNPLYFLGA